MIFNHERNLRFPHKPARTCCPISLSIIFKNKSSYLKFAVFVWFAVNFFVLNINLSAQEDDGYFIPPPEKGEFWLSPSAEIALYSKQTFSYGAGFALAYGKKASIGIKGVFLFDEQNELNVLELHFLFRFYLNKGAANKGPFLQLSGGSAIIFPKEYDITLPAEFGLFSAGLSFGWRFLFGKTFFLEPSIRGGYPFIVGGAVAAGFRF